MRRVDRTTVPVPKALAGPSSAGGKEKSATIAHYSAQIALGNHSGEPSFKKFKAYKDESVKTELEKLFHGKCAYCESRYATTQPVDVEHWRPKARVVVSEEPKRYGLGYYWLASEWQNLLPACIDCNRQRGHIVDGRRTKLTLGKADWFPILETSLRTTDAASTDSEVPLLINPCTDDPFKDLAFHREGYLYPRNPNDKVSEKRALASIRFYALNRPELVKERLSLLAFIDENIATIKSLRELLNQARGPMARQIEIMIEGEIRTLERFREPTARYAAMADWFITEFMESMNE